MLRSTLDAPGQALAAMTCGAQEPVAWKPRHAPRQHSVQYMARKALLRAAPFSTLPQIAGAPALNSACLQCQEHKPPFERCQQTTHSDAWLYVTGPFCRQVTGISEDGLLVACSELRAWGSQLAWHCLLGSETGKMTTFPGSYWGTGRACARATRRASTRAGRLAAPAGTRPAQTSARSRCSSRPGAPCDPACAHAKNRPWCTAAACYTSECYDPAVLFVG